MKSVSFAENGASKEHRRQFCTFLLADNLFGVDIHHVKEIKDDFSFTPIHHAPPEIRGFVNIRGQVHLVLDMRLLLSFESKDIDETSRLLLFKQNMGKDPFGVLVDCHRGVEDVHDYQIEYHNQESSSSEEGDQKTRLSLGVCKLKHALMTILDASKFLEAVHLKNK